MTSWPRGPVAIGLVGLAVGVLYAIRVLIPHQWDPSIFLALGKESPVQTQYAERLLGHVETRASLGHDGKFFFVQANDPWYQQPEIHAAVLDRTIYRGQRMLYPTIAGGFGLFPPGMVVWTLILVNVLGLGFGSYITARVAQDLGANHWWGLTFALNIGLLGELDIDGAGIVALGLGMLGIWFVTHRSDVAAWLSLSGAALAREIMIIMAIGLVMGVWFKHRVFRPSFVVVPLAAIGIWNVFLRWRLGNVVGTGDTREIAVFPFAGIVQAIAFWATDALDLLMGVAMLALLLAFAVRALRDRGLVAWSAIPFLGLASLLSVHVWLNPIDIFRGVAPVLTAYGLLLAKSTRQAQAAHLREQVFD
ncbi:MAG TPA: hypothetical protein VJ935_06905 [Acidimicrobiia bacterium]|nr:hypothetical protein [Acidimicrobiia bacterium]